MPHLSPMNWLVMLLMLWTLISIFLSVTWWTTPQTFQTPQLNKNSYKSNSWMW